jgi:hypothetical protein
MTIPNRTPRECLQAVLASLEMASKYSEIRSQTAETVDVRERSYITARTLEEAITLIRTECQSILNEGSAP